MSDAAMPALRIGGMSKRFGSTHALSGVDLEVLPGEVHGLLGHNGSGKSTLIKVLAGYQACDAGEVVIGGRRAPNPVPAGLLREERVGFVHQSLGLVERLTVAENLWLDEIARTSGGGVSFRSLCRDAAEALGDFGQDLDPRAAVAELTAVQKANLAIVRAMSRRGARKGEVPSLLVLDEPTAFLPEEDKRKLYDLVSVVASRGASVLFVSHFLDEVLRLCDRVTVLRDGKVVLGGRATAQMGRDELVAAIVGTSQETRGPVRRAPSDQCLVRIESLRSGTIRDLSLELCGGEVLGVTGLIGSGSDQVCSALFGAGPDTSGTLSVGAHRIDLRRLTPGRALRHGISHVPADRNRFGVFGALSVTDNVAVPRLRDYAGPLGLARRRMREDARRLADSYAVRPRDPGRRLHELSGGNAQKVLLAKGLHTGPRLLLLEEPTQGVDVGARRQIEQIVLDAAAAGTAVLLSSADPDQLADLCHRVVVMADGRVDRVLEGAEVTKHHITSAYLGTPAGPVSDRPPSLDRLDRVEVS